MITMHASSWIDHVRGAGVADVAAALGFEPGPNSSLRPCPACGAERRGGEDARGPVGLRRDGAGWRCHRCGEHGDAVSFAALAVASARLAADNWRAVRDACAGVGLCSPGGIGRPGGGLIVGDPFGCLGARATEATEGAAPAGFRRFGRGLAHSAGEGAGFDRFGRASKVIERPPADEVQDLWARALEVTDSRGTREWLRGRGLAPASVADLRLARALRPCGPLPRWARTGAGAWRETGHVLILPLYGPDGRLESLRARAVAPGARPAKALAPLGTSVAGLVLACPLARLWLAGAALGDLERTPATSEVLRVGLVVTEGEPDFLTWATRWGVDVGQADAPSVVGLVAGSWTDALAAQVPTGARVVVRTHQDAAGERYAERVVQSLAGRCDVRRPRSTT